MLFNTANNIDNAFFDIFPEIQNIKFRNII